MFILTRPTMGGGWVGKKVTTLQAFGL